MNFVVSLQSQETFLLKPSCSLPWRGRVSKAVNVAGWSETHWQKCGSHTCKYNQFWDRDFFSSPEWQRISKCKYITLLYKDTADANSVSKQKSIAHPCVITTTLFKGQFWPEWHICESHNGEQVVTLLRNLPRFGLLSAQLKDQYLSWHNVHVWQVRSSSASCIFRTCTHPAKHAEPVKNHACTQPHCTLCMGGWQHAHSLYACIFSSSVWNQTDKHLFKLVLSFILCYPNISSKATYLQSRHLNPS